MSDLEALAARLAGPQYEITRKPVLILASYCGGDGCCTDFMPCNECLAMCNVALASGTIEVLGGMDFVAARATQTQGNG